MMPRLIAQVCRIDRIPRLENAVLRTSECVDSGGIDLPFGRRAPVGCAGGRAS